jgi:hypothetical protein
MGLSLDMLAPFASSPNVVTWILCASSVCKAMCGVAAGATRSSLTAHFASQGNTLLSSIHKHSIPLLNTLFSHIRVHFAHIDVNCIYIVLDRSKMVPRTYTVFKLFDTHLHFQDLTTLFRSAWWANEISLFLTKNLYIDNMADIAAKEGSQETLVNMIGLVCGMAFAKVVNPQNDPSQTQSSSHGWWSIRRTILRIQSIMFFLLLTSRDFSFFHMYIYNVNILHQYPYCI